MDPSIIDSIASGDPASDITQSIKDTLYAKAAGRIDDFKQFASSNLFGYMEDETEVDDSPEEVVGEYETEE